MLTSAGGVHNAARHLWSLAETSSANPFDMPAVTRWLVELLTAFLHMSRSYVCSTRTTRAVDSFNNTRTTLKSCWAACLGSRATERKAWRQMDKLLVLRQAYATRLLVELAAPYQCPQQSANLQGFIS
eukprot:1494131-Amphidinium_carterae.1